MNTKDVTILYWDNLENFKLRDTQIGLGLRDENSLKYKNVYQFYHNNEFDNVLNQVNDNDTILLLVHVDKGNNDIGLKEFKLIADNRSISDNKFVAVSKSGGTNIYDYDGISNAIQVGRVTPYKKSQLFTPVDNLPTTTSTQSYPNKIAEGVKKFKEDNSSKKTAFIMTSFSGNHTTIIEKIKETLINKGIDGFIATDKEYEEDLFANIQVYMHCCDFGIGIFTKIDNIATFNPNLSLEVGYMMGLGKKVCYLKEKKCDKLDTDLLSKLYKEFDAFNINKTLPDVLIKWLEDKGIITKTA